MTLDALIDSIPTYAKDLKLNFSTLVRQPGELNEEQVWGTVLASAIASGSTSLMRVSAEEAAKHLSPQAMEAAKTAAAIMGMNNIYYRFLHLTTNEKYRTMPARLRMNAIRSHGGDPVNFELWCIAVSAIHGCGTCVDSHEKVLRSKGLEEEKILAVVRIASVIHAIASIVDAQEALPESSTAPAETVTHVS